MIHNMEKKMNQYHDKKHHVGERHVGGATCDFANETVELLADAGIIRAKQCDSIRFEAS